MEFETFVRKPFVVQAIEITEENIEQLAPLIGTFGRKEEDNAPYIQVDKKKVPNVFRVFPGFWMTKMNNNIRCYARRIFMQEFVEITPDLEEWVTSLSQPKGLEVNG